MMSFLLKSLKTIIIFPNRSILDLCPIQLFLNKYSLTCKWPRAMYCRYIFRTLSYTSIHIVAYWEPCVTLAYSEPCHIQNPGIFRAQDIFRTLSSQILAYSKRCVTLAYWEHWHIQNCAILGLLENRLTFLMKIKHSTFLLKIIFLKKRTTELYKFIKESFQFKIKISKIFFQWQTSEVNYVGWTFAF